jgi:hypothetical protein
MPASMTEPGQRTQKLRRFHLAVHRGFARGLGVAILVIERVGAAVLQKVSHRREAGIIDDVRIHQLEDAVDLVEPLHYQHVGVVDGYQVSHKRLEEVVVRVDQAGVDKLARGV